MRREWKSAVSLLLAAAFLIITGQFRVDALTGENRTVRVAFPVQQGLTYFDQYGNYAGYTYEYLEEVAQYTGWDYEFVEAPGTLDESLTSLMEMTRDGELDLMGAIVYSEGLDELFDYSSHSYGASETVLQVLLDDPHDVIINSQSPQTFRVAVIGEGTRIIREFEDYCEMNLITPEYVRCESDEEQVQALRENRADMLLNTSVNYVKGVRTIAKFSPKPFYFVTANGNDSGLLEELNAAIQSIDQADPFFTTTLYEKYFVSNNDTLLLSAEEKDYIKEAGTLRVGFLTDQPPFQYQEDGVMKGISVDLLNYISQETGLQFEMVPASTEQEIYQLAEEGKIDLLAGIPYNYETARTRHVSMTRPYTSSQYILLMNESISEDSIRGKRLALVSSSMYGGTFVGEVSRYSTISDCVHAVAEGKADYTYVDSYTAQYYMNLPQFRNLKMVPQTYEPYRVCFGIVKPITKELLSTLNKVIVTIPEVDLQGMINQNTIQKPDFTLSYIVQENPIGAVAVLAGVSLFIIAVLLFFLRQRARMSKQSGLELKKHYQLYALMNEYIFEYNFRSDSLLVSIPVQNGRPELLHYDFSQRREENRELERARDFREEVVSRLNGVDEIRVRSADDQYHWLRVAQEIVYDEGDPVCILGKINVIDEEKREKDALLQKAQTDSLTHLYNAETCRNRISDCLSGLKKDENGALLILDIDHFKSINDTYGHMQGDEALVLVAQLLRTTFRQEDIVGRPGGDEFTVYMKRVKDTDALSDKCGDLCERVRGLVMECGGKLTISMGAALCVEGDGYDELYQLVDQALYSAKELGRDRFHIAERPET